MKFSRRTVGIVALLSVSACVFWPSIGRSQNPGPRIRIKPRDGARVTATSAPDPLVDNSIGKTIGRAAGGVPKIIPTEVDKLNMRIDELESKLVAQQKLIDEQKQTLVAQQKTIDKVTDALKARPQGYTKAFITLGNFHRLPPTDAISYWARMK